MSTFIISNKDDDRTWICQNINDLVKDLWGKDLDNWAIYLVHKGQVREIVLKSRNLHLVLEQLDEAVVTAALENKGQKDSLDKSRAAIINSRILDL